MTSSEFKRGKCWQVFFNWSINGQQKPQKNMCNDQLHVLKSEVILRKMPSAWLIWPVRVGLKVPVDRWWCLLLDGLRRRGLWTTTPITALPCFCNWFVTGSKFSNEFYFLVNKLLFPICASSFIEQQSNHLFLVLSGWLNGIKALKGGIAPPLLLSLLLQHSRWACACRRGGE